MFLASYKETKEEIEKSQNPFFLYDNDTDGLCSFILLRRFLGRGEGTAVKSYPDLSEQYLDKIDKTRTDCVIVLDIHSLSDKFIEGVKERGLNIVWIDHHEQKDTEKQKKNDFILYFNPLYTVKKGRNSNPTSFQAQKIADRRGDAWISLVGCIADCHLPDFSKEVVNEHKALWAKKIKTAFDAYYNTDFGKIALMLNFVLKDIPSKVKEAQDFLINAKNPEEVLREEGDNPILRSRPAELYKKYLEIVSDAEQHKKGNAIFFTYGSETSMSSEISNALVYKYPKNYIAVAYRRQGIINISLRGKNVRKILDTILKEIPNSTGGGHANAVGARIPSDKIEYFERLFEKETARFI